MDFHFNKHEGQDGRWTSIASCCSSPTASPRIRFVGELELEHAFVEGLEEAGEMELEQAYLDFLLTRGFNMRAGMVLVPVGIINERHEPPVYHGVERTVRGHGDHPDDVVRGRRGRSRRGRARLALSGAT